MTNVLNARKILVSDKVVLTAMLEIWMLMEFMNAPRTAVPVQGDRITNIFRMVTLTFQAMERGLVNTNGIRLETDMLMRRTMSLSIVEEAMRRPQRLTMLEPQARTMVQAQMVMTPISLATDLLEVDHHLEEGHHPIMAQPKLAESLIQEEEGETTLEALL